MSARAPDPAASPPFDSERSGAETAVLRDGHATSATAQRRLPLSGVRVDFGVREPQGLAQRPGVGDFGSGAVSDVVANHEHLISEPDLRPVQIVESNLQRLGLDGIGPKHMRRLHVTPRFDDSLSGLRLPQIGLVHLDHEAGGATDHDDTREARQPFRFGEFFSGVIRCGYDTGSSWWVVQGVRAETRTRRTHPARIAATCAPHFDPASYRELCAVGCGINRLVKHRAFAPRQD